MAQFSTVTDTAAVSNAVAHVVAVDDAFEYQDWLGFPLMVSGLLAFVAALIGGVLHAKRTRSHYR